MATRTRAALPFPRPPPHDLPARRRTRTAPPRATAASGRRLTLATAGFCDYHAGGICVNVRPAIVRELRAQARLPSSYALRVLGAAALLLATFLFAARTGFGLNEGSHLFGWLNFTLFLSIWIIVPLLAADCISVERREGTLGLLFLTPLTARDIVVAKGFVHGLRALTIWLAVTPILAIPLLLGGASWRELAMSVANNFSALCLALAAGLVASSFFKNWLRSLAAACGLACSFAGLYLLAAGVLMASLLDPGSAAVSSLAPVTKPALARFAVPSLVLRQRPL